MTLLFVVVFFREDPNITISGPSSAFHWRADGGSTLNAGLVVFSLVVTRFSGNPDQYC